MDYRVYEGGNVINVSSGALNGYTILALSGKNVINVYCGIKDKNSGNFVGNADKKMLTILNIKDSNNIIKSTNLNKKDDTAYNLKIEINENTTLSEREASFNIVAAGAINEPSNFITVYIKLKQSITLIDPSTSLPTEYYFVIKAPAGVQNVVIFSSNLAKDHGVAYDMATICNSANPMQSIGNEYFQLKSENAQGNYTYFIINQYTGYNKFNNVVTYDAFINDDIYIYFLNHINTWFGPASYNILLSELATVSGDTTKAVNFSSYTTVI